MNMNMVLFCTMLASKDDDRVKISNLKEALRECYHPTPDPHRLIAPGKDAEVHRKKRVAVLISGSGKFKYASSLDIARL